MALPSYRTSRDSRRLPARPWRSRCPRDPQGCFVRCEASVPLQVLAQTSGGVGDPILHPRAGPQPTPGFTLLLLHFDLGRGGLEVLYPLVHAPLNLLGGPHEPHEVDRLGAAPEAEGEAVVARL